MKKTILVLSALCAFQSLAFAKTCERKAEIAAFDYVRPSGNSVENSVFASIDRANLTKVEGTTLTYRVKVDFDRLVDSTSYPLASEYYVVTATGSKANCDILDVRRKF